MTVCCYQTADGGDPVLSLTLTGYFRKLFARRMDWVTGLSEATSSLVSQANLEF